MFQQLFEKSAMSLNKRFLLTLHFCDTLKGVSTTQQNVKFVQLRVNAIVGNLPPPGIKDKVWVRNSLVWEGLSTGRLNVISNI